MKSPTIGFGTDPGQWTAMPHCLYQKSNPHLEKHIYHKQKERQTMAERNGLVTLKGNPVTLTGNEVKVGDKAPDAELTANNLAPVKISGYKGKVCIISAVPSLDTPICDMETRRFNTEADKLGKDVAILTISMDLPFAQTRWCGAAGVDKVVTLSDHRNGEFGEKYGVLIKGLRLLARSLFVIDKQGVIQYIQIVPEVGQEPNYDAVLSAARKLI